MKLRVILSLCIALLLAGAVSADSRFTGAVDDLWSNPDNWNNGLPDENDKVQVQGGQMAVLDYDAGTIKHLALEGGGTTHVRLVDGAQVSVRDWTIIAYGGSPDEPHLLEVLGGVYNADARLFVARAGNGMLVVDHGGVVNVNAQNMQIGQGTGGTGRVELRGGSLNFFTNDGNPLRFRTGQDATGSMDLSGGVITMAYTENRFNILNGYIDDGSITAYNGVGAVGVEIIEDEDPTTTSGDSLLVKGLHPLTPGPEDGGSVVPGTVTLSWTLPDPCTAGQPVPVDVYFTDDLQALKSFLNPDAIRIAGQQNITSKTVQVEKGVRYYWAVDTYQGTDNDPVWGPIFEFYVDNMAPVVSTGLDVTTWVEDGTVDVALDGSVEDIDPTTVTWTVVSEPNAGDAVIAGADQEDTIVTLTAVGTYELQLEADDGEKQGSDTVVINVYVNSCLAAQSLPDYQPLLGDLDGDCDVDQDDKDLLLENWLKCAALGECDPNGI